METNYLEKYNPARIIVETSGSAFPAPIAIQIRQLTQENKLVHLDSIITVIDCVNFRGYEVSPLYKVNPGYFLYGKVAGKVY